MMTLTKYGIREWGVGLVAAVVVAGGRLAIFYDMMRWGA